MAMDSTESDFDLWASETTSIWTPNSTDPPPIKCNHFKPKNITIIIGGGYEGIPQNLFINVLGWLFLLFLFGVLRKTAWNYGRIALIQKRSDQRKILKPGYRNYNIWTQLFYGGESAQLNEDDVSVQSVEIDGEKVEEGIFTWIWAVFRVKDADILRKCGQDAVQYMMFQRYVIAYMILLVVVSVGIVLPVNFQGDQEGDEKTFGHTTISNLPPRSPLLWLHVTLSLLFLPIGIMFMRHFSRRLRFEEPDTHVTRTLMISGVPRAMCSRHHIVRHFQEAYPDVTVRDVQFAYDIASLNKLDKKREAASQARDYAENYLQSTGIRMEMRPYACGNVCVCCDIFGAAKVDAIEFYTEEEMSLLNEVESKKSISLERPLGIVFVTLNTIDMAKQVHQDHRLLFKCVASSTPVSTVAKDLKISRWIVGFAPPPEDIYWENLSMMSMYWYVKYVLVNLGLFIILFFLTTPAIIVNNIEVLNLSSQMDRISPLLSEFLPTLLLWTLAALLPVFVVHSDRLLNHWTRSAENLSVMRKTYYFLLFMVIILPSLGLTSAKAFLESTFLDKTTKYRWNCMFLPDNGAFFVNYVITSAFIGTALEIIRFPELLMYVIRLILARSRAELSSVRAAILWEFQFGVQYSWMLLIFAVTVIYSLSCPLITPFGLVYMLLKHFVDRYNIYFAYGPSKINKAIHECAINCVIVSIVLLQLCLLFFSLLRQGDKWSDISMYSIVGFCITALIYLGQTFFNVFTMFRPITYSEFRNEEEHHAPTDDDGRPFIPPVLQSSMTRTARKQSDTTLHYGTHLLTDVSRNAGTQDSNGHASASDSPALYQNYTDRDKQPEKNYVVAKVRGKVPALQHEDEGSPYNSESDSEILVVSKPSQPSQ